MSHTYTSTGHSAHQTTGAGVEEIVVLDKGYQVVQITNWDAANFLYCTIAKGPADESNPAATANADNVYKIGPLDTLTLRDDEFVGYDAAASRVRLFSAAAVAYSVSGFSGVVQ